MRSLVIALILLIACGSREAEQPDPPPSSEGVAPAPVPSRCTEQEFVTEVAVAEASGAVWVPPLGNEPAQIVIVGDSGNKGQFAIIDAGDGHPIASGALPMDGSVSDDLEGLSRVGNIYYGLTSGGWLRHWRRTENRFELITPGYAIAPRHPLDVVGGARLFVCKSPKLSNCARNYEGLCLIGEEDDAASCRGFAASKSDGRLYCLVRGEGESLSIDPTRFIDVAYRGALTGCHFSVDGSEVWVGTNAIGGNLVFAVRGWRDPPTATIERIASIGSGFPEALAVGPAGATYRFSDLAGSPSLADKYVCD